MRKNGTYVLQGFLQGPSLVCREHISALRSLVDYQQNETLVGAAIRALGLGGGASVRREAEAAMSHDQLCASMGMEVTDRSKPFAFSSGIAVIPVHGALLHRDNWSDSYATGYDYIANKLSLAMADPDVEKIVYDVNSYGGQVAGNFELCDVIRKASATKPSLAMVDCMAYSGGYSIATAAGSIAVTPSGGVGSIGVVMMHVSVQEFLEKHGVEVSFIHAGDHKVDGNMFTNLPKEVRDRYQANVDKSYEKFVSLVATNRDMKAADVRATEALCYDADEALALGLIDVIDVPAKAVAAFRQGLYGSNTKPQQGATTMSDNSKVTGDNATVADNNTAVAAPAPAAAAAAPAPAAAAAPVAAPAAAASPDAAASERARIQSITGAEEAKGREALASHLAFNTTMSADEAKKTLALAPVVSGNKTDHFAAAMDSTAQPGVGAGGLADADAGDKKPGSIANRIVSAYAAETGSKEVISDKK